jgi:hypothetical protein
MLPKTGDPARGKLSPLFEITSVFVCLNHEARCIENANHTHHVTGCGISRNQSRL